MKSKLYKLVAGLIGLALLTLAVLHYGVLPYFDNRYNAVATVPAYPVSDQARAFHRQAYVADLHADPLLWGRNLAHRYDRGQIDLPRLRDGGVNLQVFGVVTKVPRNRNYHSNSGNSDSLPILFIAAWHHPATWFSAKQRALAQARDLQQLAARSPLRLVLTADDLQGNDPGGDNLNGLLALEGMHALEGSEAALQELYDAGFRMMGLAHFFDNAVAGSVHGEQQYGLTPLGRKLIPQMEALGITVDIAHASVAAINDTFTLATKPVVFSHGGVVGTCPGNRNMSDHQLRQLAANGGVIGIGYWQSAVCDVSVKGIIQAIQYAINIAGVDHVGLGSDFDGTITTPFDTTGLAQITAGLMDAGLSQNDIKKVMGENVRRLLRANLPDPHSP